MTQGPAAPSTKDILKVLAQRRMHNQNKDWTNVHLFNILRIIDHSYFVKKNTFLRFAASLAYGSLSCGLMAFQILLSSLEVSF